MREAGLSLELVERLWAIDTDRLPAPVRAMAGACLLDWLGVAIAGAGEPVVACLMAEAADRGATGRCSVVGRPDQVGPLDAARINGTASHALDYDDSLPAMRGHASVSIIPALLAIAQNEGCGAIRLHDAIVIGHEAAGWLGAMLGPDHYLRGFHATATLGAMASALAAAHLIGLDPPRALAALSVAATDAAGLRAMFGTMGKPFHAGSAAASGVLAARLAQRGFIGTEHPLDHAQGFAATHGSALQPVGACPAPAGGFHILGNLFKYNAACYGVQNAIGAAISLREDIGQALSDTATVQVRVAPELDNVCNVAWPTSGLEMKFSLRAVVAMALRGIDMARPEAFADTIAADAAQHAAMQRVEVILDAATPTSRASVSVMTANGQRFDSEADLSQPDANPSVTRRRVSAKFLALTTPLLGSEQAQALAGYADATEIDPGRLLGLTRAAMLPGMGHRP